MWSVEVVSQLGASLMSFSKRKDLDLAIKEPGRREKLLSVVRASSKTKLKKYLPT